MLTFPLLSAVLSRFAINASLGNRFRRLVGCGLLLAFVCLWGCDRTQELVEQSQTSPEGQSTRSVATAISPRSTIDECLAAYGRLSSYQDNAEVVLRYTLDGEPHTDRAPLAIAWQRGGGIGLNVYSLRAGPTHHSGQLRWLLRVERDDLAIGNQVLSRAVSKETTIDWLLSDPLVASNLGAGLGGFPPQVDLLLSDRPFQGLVDQSSMLSFGEQAMIDGRACHVIRVARGALRYQLFIDQATMLIRRLQLPESSLPPALRDDPRISDTQLTIEFDEVRANREVDWSQFAVRVRGDEVLVSHFVPEPLPLDTDGLGVQVPAFRLESADGKTVYDSTANSANVTVFMWLADHPACHAAAQEFAEAAKAINADNALRGLVEFVSVWAEPQPPAGQSFDSLAESWNLPGTVALDRDALGRDLFRIAEAPSMIVLDAENRVQIRESRANPLLGQVLPGLLERIASGSDLAEEMLSENQYAQARFRTELHAARAIDGRSSRFADLAAYPPATATLKKKQTIRHANPVTAMASDSSQQIWTLHANGQLDRASASGSRPTNSYETEWIDRKNARLLVDRAGQFIALCELEKSNVEILDLESGQNRVLRLNVNRNEQSKLVDCAWLDIQGSAASRLAAITTDGELILLDPQDREQLSGRCPSAPLALVTGLKNSSDVDGMVVLANGAIEPIQLSDQSTLKNKPLLGRPASAVNANSENEIRRLSFLPGLAPWQEWHDSTSSWMLARGWIAQDEPAVFLLDSELNPRWHHRVALHGNDAALTRFCVSKDPATGIATWLMSDGDQTIHILRIDGLTDHFRVQREFVGLTLVPDGDQFILGIAYPNETEQFSLTWK